MTDRSAPIRNYMTPSPHTIGRDQTIAFAEQMMREHGIRHLPVLHGGELLGVISDRDVRLITSLKGLNAEEVKVEEAIGLDPYTVGPEAPLVDVVAEMAKHKYGSALVVENHKVLGIFTTIDALHTLRDLLS